MTKTIVQELKSIDITAINNYVYNSIRTEVSREQYHVYEVALLFLALERQRASGSKLKFNIESIFKSETVKDYLIKLIAEKSELIENISVKFDETTLKAAVLCSDLRQNAVSSVNSTPLSLSKLAMNLLSIKEDDILLDLGSGVGGFLIEAGFNYKCKARYGVEINKNNIVISTIKSYIIGHKINFVEGNIISGDFSSLSATKVFSDFPFGMKIPDIEKDFICNPNLEPVFKYSKRTHTSDWVFILAAYFAMKTKGKCVCIMSNSGTWNQADEETRKMMIEKGIIEGIISLPRDLLTGASIPISMIILSGGNKNIKMIDATETFTEGRRQNILEKKDIEKILGAYNNQNNYSKIVEISEIQENNYVLNPARYIDHCFDIKDTITMEEVAVTISRGAMIRSSELDQLITSENTLFSYLMLRNIKDGVIDSLLPRLSSIEEKHEKYCIQNQSLIISKNSPFKIAMANFKKDEKVLANGNLYFIKIDDKKINPVFVEAFLQSEAGLSQLARLSKGTVIDSISIQDLKRIKLPKISREKQNLIAQQYERLKGQQVELERQIEIIRDERTRLLEGVV